MVLILKYYEKFLFQYCFSFLAKNVDVVSLHTFNHIALFSTNEKDRPSHRWSSHILH